MAVGDLQSAREGIHATDVRVEQIHRFKTFTADLGVEVEAARFEPAHAEHDEHDLCREIDVDGELVGVPPE